MSGLVRVCFCCCSHPDAAEPVRCLASISLTHEPLFGTLTEGPCSVSSFKAYSQHHYTMLTRMQHFRSSHLPDLCISGTILHKHATVACSGVKTAYPQAATRVHGRISVYLYSELLDDRCCCAEKEGRACRALPIRGGTGWGSQISWHANLYCWPATGPVVGVQRSLFTISPPAKLGAWRGC